MEPITGDGPSTGDHRWAYQPAWSGQRVMVHVHGAPTGLGVWPRLRLVAPNGADLTGRFPELDPLADDRPKRPRVFDAILVAAGANGTDTPRPAAATIDLRKSRPTAATATEPGARVLSPAGLGYRLAATSLSDAQNRAVAVPIRLLVIDIVHVAGRRVGDLPYVGRRSVLSTELPPGGQLWEVPPDHLDVGEALVEAIHGWGVSSLVAKRLDSRYFPGLRSAGWNRINYPVGAELVIAGWVRSPRGGHLDGLVLARRDPDGTLAWAGVARSGLTLSLRAGLAHQFGRLVTDRPTVAAPATTNTPTSLVRWLRPELGVDVVARDERLDGSLIDPVVLGLVPA